MMSFPARNIVDELLSVGAIAEVELVILLLTPNNYMVAYHNSMLTYGNEMV